MNSKDIKEITEAIKTGDVYNKVSNCRCCGSCVSTWPDGHRCSIATKAQGVQVNCRGFNGIIKNIKDGNIEFSEGMVDLIYRCVTCHVCVQNCSEHVDPVNYLHALRMELVERGIAPKSVVEIFKSVTQNGNVWGGAEKQRSAWTEGLDVKFASETDDFEYLLFVGDSSAYVPRNQKTARAFIEILNKLGVKFAILGNEEKSSGNEVLRMGEEGLFEMLAEENIGNFKKYNVKKIITLSPHGYDALKNEYSKFDPELQIEVLHSTEFLHKMLTEGKLKFTKEINKTVTYHDPCYLGRHNSIYDQPRELLNAIPGLKLVEMEHNGKYAVCCGGGGGGIWMPRGDGVKVEEIRFDQAVKTNADVLVVACPLCAQMFEAENEKNQETPIVIQDIVELVHEAM